MPSVLTFDPGLSTGIVYGVFGDDYHYEHREIWQVEGGFDGLDDWLSAHHSLWLCATHRVVEKFIPRPIDGGSHTLESTYPLVQEGLLMARGVIGVYPEGNWQPATSQTLAGGKDADERRHNTDQLLKRAGLWLTGTDVGRDDANDVLSATRHTLHFLTRTIKHQPTREWLYGEETS